MVLQDPKALFCPPGGARRPTKRQRQSSPQRQSSSKIVPYPDRQEHPGAGGLLARYRQVFGTSSAATVSGTRWSRRAGTQHASAFKPIEHGDSAHGRSGKPGLRLYLPQVRGRSPAAGEEGRAGDWPLPLTDPRDAGAQAPRAPRRDAAPRGELAWEWAATRHRASYACSTSRSGRGSVCGCPAPRGGGIGAWQSITSAEAAGPCSSATQ